MSALGVRGLRPPARLSKRFMCRDRDMAQMAKLVKTLANEKRLLTVCKLAAAGEMCVHALATATDLSSSAVSQHLATLRRIEIVSTRREAQKIHYRLTDSPIDQVLGVFQSTLAGGARSARSPAEQ